MSTNKNWPHNPCNPDQQGAHHPCPQLPGTVLRIYIPPGAEINLLNLIEVTSPAGICLIIRIPLLGGSGSSLDLDSIINQIKQAGGSVEFAKE